MNEKILNIIHKKLCDGFKTSFLTSRQFESEFSKISNDLLKIISELTETYRRLKNSKIEEEFKQVIKLTKDDFILKQFNSQYHRGYSYGYSSKKYTIDNLIELQIARPDDFKSFSKQYDEYLESGEKEVVVPLLEYIENGITDKLPEGDTLITNKNNSLENLFWDFFNKNYLEKDHYENYRLKNISDIVNTPDNIIKKFSDNYLSNKLIRLLDKAEKKLANETLSNFDTIIINVGLRDFENGRAGWATNSFKVINNNIEYFYTTSSKDEKLIKGEFVNIFIHQKKHLIKISITLDDVERIPYIIYRDCEKVSLKNDNEIVIVKHHGNETIVFDESKEAITFQTKLIEIREGMGRQK